MWIWQRPCRASHPLRDRHPGVLGDSPKRGRASRALKGATGGDSPRLYITAKPRIYGENARSEAREADAIEMLAQRMAHERGALGPRRCTNPGRRRDFEPPCRLRTVRVAFRPALRGARRSKTVAARRSVGRCLRRRGPPRAKSTRRWGSRRRRRCSEAASFSIRGTPRAPH